MFACILLVAGTALGQPAVVPAADTIQAPAPSARERAEVLLGEGLRDVVAERWQEALDHFLEAQDLYASPLLVFNIGYCERALGRSVAAMGHLHSFLDAELTGLAATRREEAEGYLRELEGRIAHLVVRVDESTDGLAVSVDGQGATGDALNRALDPGYHSVQALRDGHRPFFAERRLAPGERWNVVIHIKPLPGHLRVTADVLPATVELNGESRGDAPADFDLEPGAYRLLVTSPGHTAQESELHVAPGASLRVHAHLPLTPTPLRKRWWFWSVIGAGVLAVGTAAFLLGRPEPSPPPYDGGNLGWVAGQTPAP